MKEVKEVKKEKEDKEVVGKKERKRVRSLQNYFSFSLKFHCIIFNFRIVTTASMLLETRRRREAKWRRMEDTGMEMKGQRSPAAGGESSQTFGC